MRGIDNISKFTIILKTFYTKIMTALDIYQMDNS